MANIIAVIWDCDRTLIDGYMQDPIFEDYGVDAGSFWKEVQDQLAEYDRLKVRVNKDTYYLNHFIKKAHDGTFAGLNNQKLREYGQRQKFYQGIPDIFEDTRKILRDNRTYAEYGIQVEHYIVSTGFAEVIRGSLLNSVVDDIWGCELAEAPDSEGNPVISEVLYTIDNTTKTRALFEINKGIGVIDKIEVNSKIPEENRRVRFENMIYVADGPSDIPAFSVIKKNGGATFAIYPHNNRLAMRQVEQMRKDGRVDMYAEADYSEGSTAWLWLTEQILQKADRICTRERARIAASASDVPRHLT